MAFELQQLRQVIALAEHGSFVRAAAALHISQPALSRSIQNLERHFGSELFQRSSVGVVPTDVGRLYIERARDVLRLAEDLERDAGTQRTLRGGSVAVGAGPFPFESFLGPAAARLTDQFPGVSVQLRSRDWDDLVRELRSRQLDFFIAETSTLQREPDLEIAPLPSKHAIYLVARAGHPLTASRQPRRGGHVRLAVRRARSHTATYPGPDAVRPSHSGEAREPCHDPSRRSSAMASRRSSASSRHPMPSARRSFPALQGRSSPASSCCSRPSRGCT